MRACGRYRGCEQCLIHLIHLIHLCWWEKNNKEIKKEENKKNNEKGSDTKGKKEKKGSDKKEKKRERQKIIQKRECQIRQKKGSDGKGKIPFWSVLVLCLSQLAVSADAVVTHHDRVVDDRHLTTTFTPQTPFWDFFGNELVSWDPQMKLFNSSYVQLGAPGNGSVRLPWNLSTNALPESLRDWEDVAWLHPDTWQEGTGAAVAGVLFMFYVVSLNAACAAGKCMGFKRKRKNLGHHDKVSPGQGKKRYTLQSQFACVSCVFVKNMRKKKGRIMKRIMIRARYLRRKSFRKDFEVNGSFAPRDYQKSFQGHWGIHKKPTPHQTWEHGAPITPFRGGAAGSSRTQRRRQESVLLEGLKNLLKNVQDCSAEESPSRSRSSSPSNNDWTLKGRGRRRDRSPGRTKGTGKGKSDRSPSRSNSPRKVSFSAEPQHNGNGEETTLLGKLKAIIRDVETNGRSGPNDRLTKLATLVNSYPTCPAQQTNPTTLTKKNSIKLGFPKQKSECEHLRLTGNGGQMDLLQPSDFLNSLNRAKSLTKVT